jgi:glycosyltransferase involved in cell wall biosynthesis
VRLALLTDDWQPTGGVASYVRLVAPALARLGHEVLVLHAGPQTDEPVAGVTVTAIDGAFRHFNRRVDLAAVPLVIDQLRQFRADVVHLHSNENFPLVEAVRQVFPIIKTVHTLDSCPAGSKFHFATQQTCHVVTGPLCLPRQVYLRCTLSRRPRVIWRQYLRGTRAAAQLRDFPCVTVASEYIRRLSISNGVAPERVSVIPYYTSCPEHVTPADSRTILFVGRITPEKGLDLLLDALTRVPGDWRLSLVGDGIGMAQTRRRVSDMGLDARVTFHGWLTGDALAQAYRDAAVVVVPSRWPEPFGIVGIEAMAHGRPVVAFGVGGIPEWLADGVGGFLVPPADVVIMAERIAAVLANPAEAGVMALRGRARVQRDFSEEAHLAGLVPLYERVCAGGR